MTMRKLIFYVCILASVFTLSACIKQPKPSKPGDVILIDEAGLLNDEEEEKLRNGIMKDLSEFGNVMVYTDRPLVSSTRSLATSLYDNNFGTDSGFLFVIDMVNREIYVETDGYIGDYIGRGTARTITDNCYSLASRDKFYECSESALTQAYRVLNGQRISEKMKYISNAAIALVMGFLLNFILLRRLNRKTIVTNEEMRSANKSRTEFLNKDITVVSRKVVKHGSSSSGHGSGGSRGGGFGGGHHSHGGGHRF